MELIKSPNVSGALTYNKLCVSAKREGQRQSELRKCQNYQRHLASSTAMRKCSIKASENIVPVSQTKRYGGLCYTCCHPDYLACDCHQRKRESNGRLPAGKKPVTAKQVKQATNLVVFMIGKKRIQVHFHFFFQNLVTAKHVRFV